MTLVEKLKLAWEKRHQIADGFYHTYISSSKEIDEEAERRKKICESNICGYYDKDGKPETSVIPGKPACSICHCNADMKSKCAMCWCALRDLQVNKMKQMAAEGKIVLGVDPSNNVACHRRVKELQAEGYDMGPDPLWEELITEDQHKEVEQKKYEEQFKPKQ